MCFKILKRVLLKWKTLKFRHSKPVIINLFTYLTPLSNKITRFTRNILNGAPLFKRYEINQLLQFEMIYEN